MLILQGKEYAVSRDFSVSQETQIKQVYMALEEIKMRIEQYFNKK